MTTREKYSHRAELNGFRVILLVGAPGSGKGTQASLLSSQFGVTSISTGAILREQAKRNTPAGFRLRQTLATGELVDDETVVEAVASRIQSLRAQRDLAAGSVILDGFPRTVAQARILDEILDANGIDEPLVIHLDVPYDVLRRRLARRRQCALCGAIYNLASGRSRKGSRCQFDGGALVERDDDGEGVVARRLAAYDAETLPVLDYYRERSLEGSGSYRRLDGNRAADEIAKDVCDLVGFVADAVAA